MKYNWVDLYDAVQNCDKCALAQGRHSVVIGMGDANADVMFIGEGPGHDEDLQGLPFVGSAGKLLDKMLHAIDISRENVYIANIVKCRPQTGLVRPKIIVCLGATAVKYVLGPDIRITRDRGKWYERKGVWIMPTYHPAALLYDETKKHDAWSDLKSLKNKINELGIDL